MLCPPLSMPIENRKDMSMIRFSHAGIAEKKHFSANPANLR